MVFLGVHIKGDIDIDVDIWTPNIGTFQRELRRPLIDVEPVGTCQIPAQGLDVSHATMTPTQWSLKATLLGNFAGAH